MGNHRTIGCDGIAAISGSNDFDNGRKSMMMYVLTYCARIRIMGADVTDHGLLDLSEFSIDTSLDESALARALTRVLAASEDGPSNDFSANI
jgi:hypothetical protein